MAAVVHVFNQVCTWVFEVVYRPLSYLGPWWSLVAISVMAGIVMVWVFGRVSNQGAIRKIRNRIRAHLMGIRLYNEDLGVFGKLLGKVLTDTGRYLRTCFVPILIMLPLVILMLIQVNLRYSARPLEVGERIVLNVKMADSTAMEGIGAEASPLGLRLLPSDAVEVETPPLRLPARCEVSWRLRASEVGNHEIEIETAGGEVISKCFRIGGAGGMVSAVRTGGSWLDLVLWPAEAPIPRASGIRSVELRYPALEMRVFGWKIHWLAAFLVISVLSGIAVKRWMKVEL